MKKLKQNELREIREAILKQLKWQLQDNLKDWGENEYNGLTTNILKAIKKPTEALYKQEIKGLRSRIEGKRKLGHKKTKIDINQCSDCDYNKAIDDILDVMEENK